MFIYPRYSRKVCILEKEMRAIVLGLAVSVTLAAAGAAEARNGCGPGYYFNGARCVRNAPPPPRYAPPPPPAYRYGPYRRVCPYGFTVQDGVCKPYRGY
jgi:hypothetical protein